MNRKSIQDILPFVEQPSRYLGTEINIIRKEKSNIKLSIALAFPDLYEIGTSHFGLQILYHILNLDKDILAERVFAPAEDMETQLRSSGIPITSLESETPLNRFHIIGFSLLYELNYTNILNILDLAEIPFYASMRDESFPFIIAGGPCMCNPEPVADFFDAIVVGDGEEVILKMAHQWLEWKEGDGKDKIRLLKSWSTIEGVYIPSFFKRSSFPLSPPIPDSSDYSTIKRAIIGDLDHAQFPKAPIIPFGRPIHDRLRLEIARGCTRGCRFCQAGMIYRPVRERSLENLVALAEESLNRTGYEDISLLSLSTGDFGCISELMKRLVSRFESEHVAVSFPSLRADTLTSELMNLIKRVRKTGFTIAPEAGSQRLRDLINKNVTEKEISETIETAFQLGWLVIKLYFMIGLPTETDEDIDALINLVTRLSKRKTKFRKGKINLSIGIFVPKPHTPFQRVSQISLEQANYRMQRIKEKLSAPKIHLKWQNPKVSILEGLFSRGDRKLSKLLVTAFQSGCRFDGWSDKFRFDLWESAIRKEEINIEDYIYREKREDSPLPWDHIDMRISKEFLKSEWEKALKGEKTEDCRDGKCMGCGCCDFERIKPICYSGQSNQSVTVLFPINETDRRKLTEKHLVVSYSKLEQAKHLGHLELVNCIIRAVRRTGIPVAYSEGFHPMPKISFQDPLPVGMESRCEKFFISIKGEIESAKLIEGLNQNLPKGLSILECNPAPPKADRRIPEVMEYEIILKEEYFSVNLLREFMESENFPYQKINFKGKIRTVDLKQAVQMIQIEAPKALRMKLKSELNKAVRPAEVIQQIFKFADGTVKQARIIKIGI